MLGAVGWKQDVRKQFLKRVAGVLRSVLNIISHGRLEPPHEVRRRRAELFNDLIPLVNVCGQSWANVKVAADIKSMVLMRNGRFKKVSKIMAFAGNCLI